MSGNRGEGDCVAGDNDPIDLPQIFILLPPFSYQTSDAHFSTDIAWHHRTDATIQHPSDTHIPFDP